jgi:hypothetical protein
LRLKGKAVVCKAASTCALAASGPLIDIFEQFDDALHAGNALHHARCTIGFLSRDEAKQVNNAVLGNDFYA